MIAARLAFIGFCALVLQTSVIAPITIFGARGDVVLLFAVAAGFEGNSDRGAVVGFAVGLAFDLLLGSVAVGLSALTYCLVGYLVGTFHNSVIRTSRWIPVATAALASALGILLYFLVAKVTDQTSLGLVDLPAIVAVVAVQNGLLALPAMRLVRWALHNPAHDRLSMR